MHPDRKRQRALFAQRDPRLYQIAVLGGLILYGTTVLDFGIDGIAAVVLVTTAQLVQLGATRAFGLPRFDPRSALISSLSLILLLRTNSLLLAASVAAVTIVSKFVLRWSRGGTKKHIWNPTNLGLALGMLATDDVWISPGQWGTAALFAFLLAGLGMLVTHRAARSDVTWAFLVAYAVIVHARALWLGDPLSIPRHQLANGGLLIFAFFMISDPKTTPDTRFGRVVFATLVACVAGFIQFGLFRPSGLIWALFLLAPLVPLIDAVLPGPRYRWRQHEPSTIPSPHKRPKLLEAPMSRLPSRVPTLLTTVLSLFTALIIAQPSHGFCGFFVAKADTSLFNKASKVVLVRDDNRTVITMANDFRGDPHEFAMVIPVPTVLSREQIHVGDPAVIDHLDAYTSPRLVEYHDLDPCARHDRRILESARFPSAAADTGAQVRRQKASALGVRIEAEYTVGEYDIVLLSARESDGLTTWLRGEGYRLPTGAERVLGSYIRQNLRFFVAKVNLGEQARLGFTFLRPLQIAYESPKFMLPIRLGTLNADGPQELFVFALTRSGRVETTNYRTVKLPSDVEIPPFVKADFGTFYRDMFTRQAEQDDLRTVFLEYAWDMAWCDPCAADPLTPGELRGLGVFWLSNSDSDRPRPTPQGRRAPIVQGGPQNVFVTRLHVRYTGETFPEDLHFQATGDRSNFQGRYILRHPWPGERTCVAERYWSDVRDRQAREARTLASLTGWDLAEIFDRVEPRGPRPLTEPDEPQSWWRNLWRPRR